VLAVQLSDQRAIALVIFIVALLGWATYVVLENKRSTKDITQSFYNAPNRKASPEDDVFEGPRLDRWLGWALVSMTLVALSLPLYWLNEPSRQTGAIRGFDNRTVKRGEKLFGNEHNGFNCAQCHGPDGGGGVAIKQIGDFNADGTPVLDPKSGKPALRPVNWVAPRVNDIALRYRPEQIRNVLIYGRGGAKNNPMPAWGLAGGGPGNAQQIDDLVNLLKYWSIEENAVAKKAYEAEWSVSRDADKAYDKAFEAAREEKQKESTEQYEETVAAAKKTVADEAKLLKSAQDALAAAKADAASKPSAVEEAEKALAETEKLIADAKKTAGASEGEVLFNLHCARCHTNGYSYGEPKEQAGGYFGPALREGSLKNQFTDAAKQHDFIKNGVPDQGAYGTGGVNDWSGGGMPYFSNTLTDEQIDAIVEYERGLK
jgi:mono/diheme cytochrome c family protein